jgi:hypothetical protein
MSAEELPCPLLPAGVAESRLSIAYIGTTPAEI